MKGPNWFKFLLNPISEYLLRKLHIFKVFLVSSLLSTGSILHAVPADNNQALVPHSIKKLDVSGSEMILIQAFVERGDIAVSSTDDMLGVSQKDKQVSLYIDYHQAPVELKEALSKKDYIRSAESLEKLLKKSFLIKKSKSKVALGLKK